MLKTILTIGFIQALAVLVNVLRSKVLAILLGPQGVGTVSIIDQAVQFTAYLSAMSLPFVSIKFLSRAHSESDESFRRSYGLFLHALLGLSALAILALCTLALFFPSGLGDPLGAYGGMVAMAALSIPAMSLMSFFTNVLAAARRTQASATLAVVANGAGTLGACAGLALGSIRTMYLSTAAANLLLVVGVLIYLRATLGLPVFDRRLPLANASAASRFGGMRLNGVVSFAFFTYLSTAAYAFSVLMARTAVSSTSGLASAGLLQAGIAVSTAMSLVITPANGLFLTPLMNRSIPVSEKLSVARMFAMRILLLLGLGGMPLVLFPQLLLRILFSSSFGPASQFLFLFVISQCILQLAGVHQALMIGLNDLRWYGLLSSCVYLATGALCYALVPSFGLAGVGYAMLSGMSALWVLTFVRLNRRFGFGLPAPTLLLAGYTVIALTAAGAFARNQKIWSLNSTLLKICICFGYSATLMAWLGKGERQRLLSMARLFPNPASESV